MATHRWKINIELECEEGLSGVTKTAIEVDGHNDTEGDERPVNECIALSMARICKMLHISGRWACGSEVTDTADAFVDAVVDTET